MSSQRKSKKVDPCEEEKRIRREHRQKYEKARKKVPKKQKLKNCIASCYKRYSRKKKQSVSKKRDVNKKRKISSKKRKTIQEPLKTMPVLSSEKMDVVQKKGIPIAINYPKTLPIRKNYPVVKVTSPIKEKKFVPLVDIKNTKEVLPLIDAQSRKIYEIQPYLAHLSSSDKPVPPGLLISSKPIISDEPIKSSSELKSDYQKFIGACRSGDLKSFTKHFSPDGCIEGLQVIAEASGYRASHEKMFIILIDLLMTFYRKLYIAPVCLIILLKLAYNNKALLLGSLVEAKKSKDPAKYGMNGRSLFVKTILYLTNSPSYEQKLKEEFPPAFFTLFTKNKYVQLESFGVGLKVNKECMGLFVQLYDGRKEAICFAANDSKNTVVFDYCKAKKESIEKLDKEIKELSLLPETIDKAPQNFLNEALEYGNNGLVNKVFDSMKKNNVQINTEYQNTIKRIASIRKPGILSTYIRHLFNEEASFTDKDKVLTAIAYNFYISWYPRFFNLSDFKLVSSHYESIPKGVSKTLYLSSIKMIPRHILAELLIQ